MNITTANENVLFGVAVISMTMTFNTSTSLSSTSAGNIVFGGPPAATVIVWGSSSLTSPVNNFNVGGAGGSLDLTVSGSTLVQTGSSTSNGNFVTASSGGATTITAIGSTTLSSASSNLLFTGSQYGGSVHVVADGLTMTGARYNFEATDAASAVSVSLSTSLLTSGSGCMSYSSSVSAIGVTIVSSTITSSGFGFSIAGPATGTNTISTSGANITTASQSIRFGSSASGTLIFDVSTVVSSTSSGNILFSGLSTVTITITGGSSLTSPTANIVAASAAGSMVLMVDGGTLKQTGSGSLTTNANFLSGTVTGTTTVTFKNSAVISSQGSNFVFSSVQTAGSNTIFGMSSGTATASGYNIFFPYAATSTSVSLTGSAALYSKKGFFYCPSEVIGLSISMGSSTLVSSSGFGISITGPLYGSANSITLADLANMTSVDHNVFVGDKLVAANVTVSNASMYSTLGGNIYLAGSPTVAINISSGASLTSRGFNIYSGSTTGSLSIAVLSGSRLLCLGGRYSGLGQANIISDMLTGTLGISFDSTVTVSSAYRNFVLDDVLAVAGGVSLSISGGPVLSTATMSVIQASDMINYWHGINVTFPTNSIFSASDVNMYLRLTRCTHFPDDNDVVSCIGEIITVASFLQ